MLEKLSNAALMLQVKVAHFAANRSGATAIEYGLIASGIALAIITTVFTLGEDVFTGMYQTLADEMAASSPGG